MTIELLAPQPGVQLALAFFPPTDRSRGRVDEQQAVETLLRALLGGVSTERAHHPDGSPYLPAHPDLALSISHTAGCAAVLLAPSTLAPGVDVETYREQLPRVASRYFHPEEWELLKAHRPLSDQERYTLLWTAKETVYKVTRPTHGSLLAYRLMEHDPQRQSLLLMGESPAEQLSLHYLFRPPYVLSFGVHPAELG